MSNKINQIDPSILNPEKFEHSNKKENTVGDKAEKDRMKHDNTKKGKEVTNIPHPMDRRSGNGLAINSIDKKHGAGKGNWGTI